MEDGRRRNIWIFFSSFKNILFIDLFLFSFSIQRIHYFSIFFLFFILFSREGCGCEEQKKNIWIFFSSFDNTLFFDLSSSFCSRERIVAIKNRRRKNIWILDFSPSKIFFLFFLFFLFFSFSSFFFFFLYRSFFLSFFFSYRKNRKRIVITMHVDLSIFLLHTKLFSIKKSREGYHGYERQKKKEYLNIWISDTERTQWHETRENF